MQRDKLTLANISFEEEYEVMLEYEKERLNKSKMMMELELLETWKEVEKKLEVQLKIKM